MKTSYYVFNCHMLFELTERLTLEVELSPPPI